jgi:hypothetical protein
LKKKLTTSTFPKNVVTFLKSIDWKNVGPKNVTTFCKMLMQND